MNQLKRYAALLLLGAMTLALMTPAYLIHVRPASAVYHRNPFVFASQVIPYVVCAVLWLPAHSASAPKIALGLSTALFVAACLLYVPVFLHPELVGRHGRAGVHSRVSGDDGRGRGVLHHCGHRPDNPPTIRLIRPDRERPRLIA